MQKVFHFDSVIDPYVCDAAVVVCFDQRFLNALHKFLKRQGIERPDIIRIAGGAKALATPAEPYETDFLLNQLRLAVKLHQAPKIMVFCHQDCGTYGGSTSFGNDGDKEVRFHLQEMAKATAILNENFPDLDVETYFIAADGVWRMSSAGELSKSA